MKRLITVTLALLLAGLAWAQTPRTYTELQSDFADNTSGDITPAMMRNYVESINAAPVGSARIPADTTITVAAADTWYDVLDGQVTCPFARGVVADGNGRLCNTTGQTWLFSARAHVSLRTVAPNRRVLLVISRWSETEPARRENFETCSSMAQWIGTQEDFQSFSAETFKTLRPDECFYLRVQCVGCTSNVIFRRATMAAQALPFVFVE
jgi:hypothetical protein